MTQPNPKQDLQRIYCCFIFIYFLFIFEPVVPDFFYGSFWFRINTPRSQGGLGPLKIPLLSDITHDIAKAYGVYLQDLGHSLR